MDKNYITVKEYVAMHDISERTARQRLANNRIPGAFKIGRDWIIPKDAEFVDGRIKSGKYINWREKSGQGNGLGDEGR